MDALFNKQPVAAGKRTIRRKKRVQPKLLFEEKLAEQEKAAGLKLYYLLIYSD